MNDKLKAKLAELVAKVKDALPVIASRVAKLVVTALALWVFERWKIQMPDAWRAIFEQLLAAGVGALGLGLLAHFVIALRLNPLDTVSPTETRRGRQQKQARKSLRATEERIAKAGAQVSAPLAHDSMELPPRDYIPAKERGDGL